MIVPAGESRLRLRFVLPVSYSKISQYHGGFFELLALLRDFLVNNLAVQLLSVIYVVNLVNFGQWEMNMYFFVPFHIVRCA